MPVPSALTGTSGTTTATRSSPNHTWNNNNHNYNNKSTDDLFQFDIESSSYNQHHSSHEFLGKSQESKESVDSAPLTTQPLQSQQPKFTSKSSNTNRSRKVQPLVYSAIGSLEKINQGSLGSFKGKVHLASQRIRIEKQHKHHSSGGSFGVVNNTSSQNNKTYQNHGQELHHSNGSHESSRVASSHSTRSTGEAKGNDDVATLLLPARPSDTVNTKINPTNNDTRDDNIDALSNAVNRHHYQHNDYKNYNDTTTTTNNINNRKSNSATLHVNTTKATTPDNINESNNTTSSKTKAKKKKDRKKRVTIDSKRQIRHVELFRPSCDAYTPRMQRKEIKYKPAEQRQRASIETMSTTMGTISRPNYRDALRRVAMIMQQHIVKIEQRFESGAKNLNLFTRDMRDEFAEENFVTPRYKYSMVNIPMGRAGVVYGMRKIRNEYKIPSADDIYEFGHQLFNQVQLSSECSIICLIYVERLMEVARVPVMATTWRPIFMCGLLLASKVWQDWASWNIEFASVYPQFSLDAINKLEVKFCKMVKWDLYISSSLYAKYYFALRSLLEKQDFRRRYVQMVGGVDNVAASEAVKVSKRSEMMKEKALSHLSLSM